MKEVIKCIMIGLSFIAITYLIYYLYVIYVTIGMM